MAAGRGHVSVPPTEAHAPGSPSSPPPRRTSAAAHLLHTPPMPVEVVPVETDLGLRPSGVGGGGRALLGVGLAEPRRAPAFDPALDPEWRVPNLGGVAALAGAQADRVRAVLERGDFPLVLGGD